MPEPGFGVAGLSCAQPQRPSIITRKKSDALGERCIEFKGLRNLGFNNLGFQQQGSEQSLGCREQQLRWQATLKLLCPT
jgi:hypothetical protein